MTNLYNRDKRANAIAEYALVLGIISLVFISMNIYMKRGLQARIADMTDNFIGEEHAFDSNPTAKSESNSRATYNGTTVTDFDEGERKLALADKAHTEYNAMVKDNPTYYGDSSFVPWKDGNITVAQRPAEDENYDLEGQTLQSQIDILTRKRDNLRLQAQIVDANADTLESNGRDIIRKANNMGCPRRHGGSCRSARARMKAEGQDLVKQASDKRKEANNLRAQANTVQNQINALQRQLNG